jgi:D-alanyl-D-alanine carboxypeptidase
MIIGKTFPITDPQALLRDDQFKPLLDANGAKRIIPLNTTIAIEQIHINSNDVVDFVKAKDWGWTSRTNLQRGLQNQITRTITPDFSSDNESHKTVTDPEALIRLKKGLRFLPEGRIIPLGEWVIVIRRNIGGKYAQVAFTRKMDNRFVEDDARARVWTSVENLSDGWFDIFGLTAHWDKGLFVDLKPLYQIIGKDGELEYVAIEFYDPFIKLVEGARADGHDLQLTSGFRTWRRQAELYKLFQAGRGNLAAPPGRSNHQQGTAFDINTQSFDSPLYKWLKINGPKFGFLRTVNNEHWHWEYRPEDAKKHGFKLPSVVL